MGDGETCLSCAVDNELDSVTFVAVAVASSDEIEETSASEVAQLSANSNCASIALYEASHRSKLVCIGGLKSVVDGLKVVVYVVHNDD